MKSTLFRVKQELMSGLDANAERDFMALPDGSAEELEELRGGLEDGSISAFALTEDGERVGTAWYSVVEECGERVLWIIGVKAECAEVYGALRGMGGSLLLLAEREGCVRIKAETVRSGVFYSLSEVGFEPVRVAMEIRTNKLGDKIYGRE